MEVRVDEAGCEQPTVRIEDACRIRRAIGAGRDGDDETFANENCSVSFDRARADVEYGGMHHRQVRPSLRAEQRSGQDQAGREPRTACDTH